MMSLETLLASAFGGLCVIGIGLLLRTSYRTADTLGEIRSSMATITATLSGVVLRVDALDRWKDQEQARQLASLQKAFDDYKQEHTP